MPSHVTCPGTGKKATSVSMVNGHAGTRGKCPSCGKIKPMTSTHKMRKHLR